MTAKKKKQGKTAKRKSATKNAARSKRTAKRQTAKKAKKAAAPAAEEGFVILLDDELSEPVDDVGTGDEGNVVRLRRDCTVEEIAGIRDRILAVLDAEPSVTVDLGSVKDVDTAFLQLLCSVRLEAESREMKFSLRNQTDLLLQSASDLGLAAQLS